MNSGSLNPSGGGGTGNATVPDSASIQPYQAFVNACVKGTDPALESPFNFFTVTNLSRCGIVSVSNLGFLPPDNSYVVLANNVMSSDGVEGFLSLMLSRYPDGYSGAAINIAGGLNAIPIPLVAGTPQIYTITFDGLVFTNAEINTAYGALTIVGEPSLTFAESYWTAGSIYIGTSDNPTTTQVASKVAELLPFANAISDQSYNAASAFGFPVASGNVVTVTDSFFGNYPYGSFVSDGDCTIAEVQAGIAGTPGATITALQALGAIVISN